MAMTTVKTTRFVLASACLLVLAITDASAARQVARASARAFSSWSLKRSSIAIKPTCCFFCQPKGEQCYDQPNHQRRHDLAHNAFSLAYQQPPAFCSKVACTTNGSPFKSNANTRTQADNHYVVSSKPTNRASPSAAYSASRAVLTSNSTLRVEASATLKLTDSTAAFQSAWLTLQGAATLCADSSTLRGTLHLARIDAARLALRASSLELANSPVLITSGSLVQATGSNLSFALTGPPNTQSNMAVNPVPFIFSGSDLQLSAGSALSFARMPDVFFDSARVTLRDSELRLLASNVRFFDSVVDLRGASLNMVDSQVWLFNTTLLHDNKVTQVKGDAPVKLGDVIGKASKPASNSATGCFQTSRQ